MSDNRWLIAFFIYCLISIAWSDYPGSVFKGWIRSIGDIVVIALILTEVQPEERVYRIFRRMAIILLPLSALFAKFYPFLGRIYTVFGRQMWVGVTGHKNALGALCAFVGIVLVWHNLANWPKIDRIDASLVALDIYLLYGSKSTTSDIIFLMGVSILVVQFLMKGDIKKLNRILVVGFCFFIVLQLLAVSFLPALINATGKDSSLTGRIPLWQELIKMGNQAPILGHGFASFYLNPDRLAELWRRVGWTPETSHNGFIEVYLNLGIVGLVILIMLLTQTHRNIMRSCDSNPEFGRLKFVLFISVLFHNFSESSFGMPSALLWLLFLLASVVVKTKPSQEIRDLNPESWSIPDAVFLIK
jgi:O-antigen ligase